MSQALNPSLDQTLIQNLALSPKQLQSLKILTMTAAELEEYLNDEYIENPLMECINSGNEVPISSSDCTVLSDSRDIADYIQNLKAPDPDGLKIDLLHQLPVQRLSSLQLDICASLIDCLDEHGLFPYSLEEAEKITGYSQGQICKLLPILKSLSPVGVFSNSIKECLVCQLRQKGIHDPTLELLISDFLPEAAEGKIGVISRSLHISTATVRKYLHTISKLYLYPFSAEQESTSYITPDVTVTCHSGEWSVSVSCSAIENYRYNDFYLQMMRQTSDKELKSYFLDRFKRCQFIFHAIEQRTYTLTKISEQIIKYQKNFFLNRGPKSPMTMNALADQIGIHPSTVSRAIKDKYIQAPAGIFLFRDLFSGAVNKTDTSQNITKEFVCVKMRSLISQESPEHPYSDSKLTMFLNQDGIKISRRTVTKYRHSLGIPDSVIRKC